MREIKFRAWIEYPYSEEDIPPYFMCYDLAFEEYEPVNDLLKSVNHLMQFTGLKDKNGKEIYEGDILRVDGCYQKYFAVEFSAPTFCLYDGRDGVLASDDFNWENWEASEIVGNIYENPELINA